MFKPKPPECTLCPLYNQQLESSSSTSKYAYEKQFAGRGFSEPEGSGSNGVIIIGDNLDEAGADENMPFRPSSSGGSVLERAINRSPGLKRNEFKIFNTVNCQPPFNKLYGTSWTGAIDHCQVHRDKWINQVPLKGLKYKQRVILALGPIAFKALTGLEGEYLNVEALRGYPIDTPYGLVIGSYHPSFINQGAQKLMGLLMLDIRKAVAYARDGFTRLPLQYNENPTYGDVMSFIKQCRSNPFNPIAFDIETPNIGPNGEAPDQIFSIQFSLKPQTGIFMNWMGYELDAAKEILALPNPKIGFNSWRFDAPMLRSVGGCVINGRHDDVLWAYHHYQPDLTIENKAGGEASISSRLGLQAVASNFNMDFHWKYMKKYKEMQRHYGIADVDALQRIWSTLPNQMKQMHVWDGYDKLRYELEPVLINMSKRGIPVDDDARVKLREIIQDDMDDQFNLMQSLVPRELCNHEPKNGYKKGWSGVKVKEGRIREIDENARTSQEGG